ncbi:class I SAM-dependent methyltransferase [soil metagenome]
MGIKERKHTEVPRYSKEAQVTAIIQETPYPVVTPAGVYPPQEDSQLLVDTLMDSGLAPRRRVADLCTGSGLVAVAAAMMGARDVMAFEISPDAVDCAEANAYVAGVSVNILCGSWTLAMEHGPFDVVTANPPYVPAGPTVHTEVIPVSAGPARAWNAGPDGRMILDPLCDSATDLLADGGTLLIVQSAFADAPQSLRRLRSAGLKAQVVASQWIPFGPVLTARAKWLEDTGQLAIGQRQEELVVIRADKP